jgi:hypothetical protein
MVWFEAQGKERKKVVASPGALSLPAPASPPSLAQQQQALLAAGASLAPQGQASPTQGASSAGPAALLTASVSEGVLSSELALHFQSLGLKPRDLLCVGRMLVFEAIDTVAELEMLLPIWKPDESPGFKDLTSLGQYRIKQMLSASKAQRESLIRQKLVREAQERQKAAGTALNNQLAGAMAAQTAGGRGGRCGLGGRAGRGRGRGAKGKAKAKAKVHQDKVPCICPSLSFFRDLLCGGPRQSAAAGGKAQRSRPLVCSSWRQVNHKVLEPKWFRSGSLTFRQRWQKYRTARLNKF